MDIGGNIKKKILRKIDHHLKYPWKEYYNGHSHSQHLGDKGHGHLIYLCRSLKHADYKSDNQTRDQHRGAHKNGELYSLKKESCYKFRCHGFSSKTFYQGAHN